MTHPMRVGCGNRQNEGTDLPKCRFRMGLKLLITDDPKHPKYFEIENWDVIPSKERSAHACVVKHKSGSLLWPKLMSVIPGKFDKVSKNNMRDQVEKMCQRNVH